LGQEKGEKRKWSEGDGRQKEIREEERERRRSTTLPCPGRGAKFCDE